MGNKKENKNSLNKPNQHKEVVFIKLLILFVVLLIPVSLMLIDLSKRFYVNIPTFNFLPSQEEVVSTDDNNTVSEDKVNGQDNDSFDFEAGIPTANAGNLDNVPQEKIDSLFEGLE